MAVPPFAQLVAHADGAVVVVTVAADGEHDGCLVGFHCQASIDPPRYAVWLSTANRTHALAQDAEHLGVHLLSEGQHPLAELFGGETGDEVDKLALIPWEAGVGGTPVLVGCANRFIGRVCGRHDLGGDHLCVLLEPVDVDVAQEPFRPLRLSEARDIDPGHPA